MTPRELKLYMYEALATKNAAQAFGCIQMMKDMDLYLQHRTVGDGVMQLTSNIHGPKPCKRCGKSVPKGNPNTPWVSGIGVWCSADMNPACFSAAVEGRYDERIEDLMEGRA